MSKGRSESEDGLKNIGNPFQALITIGFRHIPRSNNIVSGTILNDPAILSVE